MRKKNRKIIYFVSRWYEGTAYKNINFMKDNFGGEIIKDNISQVKQMIKSYKPEFMVVRGDTREDYLIPLKSNIPYILIENDVNSLRRKYVKEILEHERKKIENASAVIFTSEEHAKYYQELKKKHGWKIPYHKVIHTRPLKKDLDFEPKEKLEGLNLVYAGGTIPHWHRRTSHYGYRCYHKIFEDFIKAGWNVHIYSASYNTNRLSEYKGIGCIIHNNLPYKMLLQEMSQYTAGLHSYNKVGVIEKTFDYTQICRGNKIWDYLAAGIPTIGYQAGIGSKTYKGKWGIVIKDLEEKTLKNIPKRLAKLKITNKMREQNVMDEDIGKYRALVKVVLKEAKREDRKEIIVPNMIGISDAIKLKNHIRVYNKGATEIYRGGYIFKPRTMSEELTINMRTYREIKSHVSLIIEILN